MQTTAAAMQRNALSGIHLNGGRDTQTVLVVDVMSVDADNIGASQTGTRKFHGSLDDYYRHEELNANNFFNNAALTPRAPYRYRMTGWSIG
jgi:hypothetical protein